MVTVRQYDDEVYLYDSDSTSYCRTLTILLSYCHHRIVIDSAPLKSDGTMTTVRDEAQ